MDPNAALDPNAVPGLARGARMVADDVRGTTAVLYPEGVLLLNETAHAVVGRCDGVRSLHAIATDLAATFDGGHPWSRWPTWWTTSWPAVC
jgi:coenzyme PQQ biosynthesis protein PqqD